MRITFGKYKGDLVEDLPSSYLVFLAELDNLKYNLMEAVLDELNERFGYENDVKINGKDVKKIYRELSLKNHPDKGGSHQAMVAINEFYEKLTK